MRVIAIFLFGASTFLPTLYAQEFRLGTADGYVVGHVLSHDPKEYVHPERDYHWLRAQQLLVTQGGFGGSLLDGEFKAYGENGQLKEQGSFKKGLKHGEWRTWNSSGRLSAVEPWRNGRLHGDLRRYRADGSAPEEVRYRNGEPVGQKKAGEKRPRNLTGSSKHDRAGKAKKARGSGKKLKFFARKEPKSRAKERPRKTPGEPRRSRKALPTTTP